MIKTVFFDLETTGVNFYNSAVIQIGAILDIDGEEVDNINIKIRPHENADIDPKALQVTGLTMADLMEDKERVGHLEGYWKFMEFCGFRPGKFVDIHQRIHRAGYNILAFDNNFLNELGKRSRDAYSYAKFHWPGIDVATIACAALRKTRGNMRDFKLMSVAHNLGVNTDGQAHDALFDVRVTRDLYYSLIDRGL